MSLKTLKICVFFLNIFCLVLAKKSWWETASFYQIYPRSFKDSDGNGVGDLKGVTEKLPYLKEIGIEATWLSPFLESPMADFGYDISNFTEIDPLFGTMEDFDEMMAKANQLDIKIILDFVPNHSSDECVWFEKSAERDSYYEDFYMWHPGKMVNDKRQPPSNWMSVFRGSAWEWHEGRGEYYLHQFHKKQPDFNYRNPKVREIMNEVLRFWLRKGVAGFRIDAVDWAFEVPTNSDGHYPDEPRNEENNDDGDYYYVQHIYTNNLPETRHLVYEWRAVLDQFRKENGGIERILMIETWHDVASVQQYYGNETAEGGQMPFNFQLTIHLDTNSKATRYAELINSWLDPMPKGRTANWVIGNHDKNRIASRFGSERVNLFNILLLTLPGCSINYMGEEIGMTDGWISWEDTKDPQACNGDEEGYEWRSRDPERTPFQWNDELNAGFSTAEKTWLPVGDSFKKLNVKRERGINLSPFNIYKELQELRRQKVIQNGAAVVKALNENVLAIKRYLHGADSYFVLLNIFDEVEHLDLNEYFEDVALELKYALVTDKSAKRKGDKVQSNSVILMPHEAAVLQEVTN